MREAITLRGCFASRMYLGEVQQKRSLESLEFAGDALMTDVETICSLFRRMQPSE